MKSFTLIFVLIFITSPYASSIVISNILKRDNVEFSDECMQEYSNSECNSECWPTITISNYKQACSNIKIEKCQNFFKEPLKYYPICSKEPQFTEIFQPAVFNDLIQDLYSQCLTDEKDNLCPYSLYVITQSGEKDALTDTCKSKKCTESLLNLLKDVNIDTFGAYENLSFNTRSYSYDDLNVVIKIVSKLESDECTASHATSDVITTKINQFLLISLSFLLLFVFY